MAVASDFVAIAATLSTEVAQLATDVSNAVAEITALVNAAGTSGVNPADLDAPLASLTAAANALKAADQALAAAPPISAPPATPAVKS